MCECLCTRAYARLCTEFLSLHVCVCLRVPCCVRFRDQLQDEERRRKQQLEEIRKREAEERAKQEEERRWREEERSRREAEEKVSLQQLNRDNDFCARIKVQNNSESDRFMCIVDLPLV